RTALGAALADDDRVVAVQGEKDDRTPAVGCHARDQRFGGVEDGGAAGADRLDDGPFDSRQLFGGFNVAHAEVVALADVGDHGHVTAVEPQPFAEDAAPGGLQDGRLHPRVLQDGGGTLGPTAIPGLDAPAVDVDAFGAGHADRAQVPADNVGDQAGGG